MRRAAPRVLWFVLLALAAGATPARADWLVTPFVGSWFGGQTALVDLEDASGTTKLGFGGALTIAGDGPLGLEADFGFVPNFFERGERGLVANSRVMSLTGSVVLALPRSVTRESLRPYLSVGGGLLNARADDVLSALEVRSTMPAFSIGAGATGMLTYRTGVRFDLRYIRSLGQGTDLLVTDGERLSVWRASIGYIRRF
ncbi:MAG: hypothetical protein AB7H88_12290 [Vicinamibacterales bacterium]